MKKKFKYVEHNILQLFNGKLCNFILVHFLSSWVTEVIIMSFYNLLCATNSKDSNDIKL